jgi:ribose transport system substrate-binding protein
MKQLQRIITLLVIASLLLVACAAPAAPAQPGAEPATDATATSAPAGETKGLIAFAQAGMENEWRTMNTKEMEQAVRDAGYDFVWTNANSDPAKQLADVESLLAQKPALLVIAPLEYEALAPVPEMAKAAGVPLIVVDRALKGEPGIDNYLVLLTTDFVDTGRQVGQDVVDELTKKYGEPKGKIIHIQGTKGASPVIDEETGINEILAEYPNIEIAATCDGQYSREPGRKCTEDMLQAFAAGEIDGIIYDNDDMAIGGIQAIKAAGRDELLGWIWAKDGTVDGLQAMIDGDITFTVQTPPFFGASTMEKWQNYLDGESLGDPVQYVPKETFDNDTPEQIERLKARIEELKELGVGCC